MTKKLVRTLFVVILFFLLFGIYLYLKPRNPTQIQNYTNVVVSLSNIKIKAYLANSPQKIRDGLSVVNKLDKFNGMLFDFGVKNISPTFWMKNMKFAIDIIWIDNGRIVKIDKNVPPEPNIPSYKLKLYTPNQPIDYVLEVKAGFSNKHNLSVGDTITF